VEALFRADKALPLVDLPLFWLVLADPELPERPMISRKAESGKKAVGSKQEVWFEMESKIGLIYMMQANIYK